MQGLNVRWLEMRDFSGALSAQSCKLFKNPGVLIHSLLCSKVYSDAFLCGFCHSLHTAGVREKTETSLRVTCLFIETVVDEDTCLPGDQFILSTDVREDLRYSQRHSLVRNQRNSFIGRGHHQYSGIRK